MAYFPLLQFTKNWENPADYSAYQNNEIQNRKDIQSLFAEIQSYLNNILLPLLEQYISSGMSDGEGGGIIGDYLPLSGGTMRGVLRLFRNPQLSDEAVSKQYVDACVASVATDVEGNLSAIVQDPDIIRLLVQDAAGNYSDVDIQAKSITSIVSGEGGEETTKILQLSDAISMECKQIMLDNEIYSRLALKIGDGAVYGYIKMDGNVDVSGELSAAALYAPYGEIANLTVDALLTSRRIPRYLAGDASDDNFIRAFGQSLEFVAGVCTGGRRQATNPSGTPLYWPVNVSGLSRGADGYPRTAAGERIFITTTPTDYPVYVYNYNEAVKRSICFSLNDNNIYEPRDIFGAGNQNGGNQGYIEKSEEGFFVMYQPSDHTAGKIGISMKNDGHMDLYGLRKVVALDFSNWSNGVFTETLEGNIVNTYGVAFDSKGRPVTITDGSGNQVAITWG